MSQIVVVGSCSMDLVVTSNKRPNAGETVLGESFKTVPREKEPIKQWQAQGLVQMYI